jgi:hypothetical protein
MGAAAKGPLDERVRTDLRISGRVLRVLGEQGRKLGIPKNALFTLGACLISAKLVPMLARGPRKRNEMLDDIEALVVKTISDARERH